MRIDASIELFVDANAIVGECPVWDCQTNALYWIDVKAPALSRSSGVSGATVTWRLPSDIGGFALAEDGGSAVVALRTGLFCLDLKSSALSKLADPPFDPRTHRFNEVDCDLAGRLWLGVMFEPESGVQAEPQKGAICSFTCSAGLITHSDYALTPNGFAWSLDARTLYVAHTKDGRIEAVEFDLARGRLGASRTFCEIDKQLGVPDGGAVDAHGFYWSAIHGGGRLRRYAPDGRLDREVLLPVRNPTMMAFGGSEFKALYVTSASHGRLPSPDGGVLRLNPEAQGRLRPRFRS
jgi:sugar lactone lactonase YvrE